MRFLCKFNGHRRSRDLAKMEEDGRLHSNCERCGARLIKTWDKGWVVEGA